MSKCVSGIVIEAEKRVKDGVLRCRLDVCMEVFMCHPDLRGFLMDEISDVENALELEAEELRRKRRRAKAKVQRYVRRECGPPTPCWMTWP